MTALAASALLWAWPQEDVLRWRRVMPLPESQSDPTPAVAFDPVDPQWLRGSQETPSIPLARARKPQEHHAFVLPDAGPGGQPQEKSLEEILDADSPHANAAIGGYQPIDIGPPMRADDPLTPTSESRLNRPVHIGPSLNANDETANASASNDATLVEIGPVVDANAPFADPAMDADADRDAVGPPIDAEYPGRPADSDGMSAGLTPARRAP